ncbi:MAG: molybdopterin-dependent oxidoreductase [Paracoccaceae bacterium]|nr:molybdopterin-dependent oxidoreductase [Paracoccaceae bacterium]
MSPPIPRRRLLRLGLAGLGALPLAGCKTFDFLADPNDPTRDVLVSANRLTKEVQRSLQGRRALATEYTMADLRQGQKPNGTTDPQDPAYLALKAQGFRDYRLSVTGAVARPVTFSLADLHALPQQSQITRHDCVEGWSAIAKWSGVRLAHVLTRVQPTAQARFLMFECFDTMEQGLSGAVKYYETIDMVDALHPQTILAVGMNDQPLPVANGAPVRLRVERQLGYKMAKYVRAIHVIPDFRQIEGGRGGYWEDRGYEWYAGI